MRREQDPTVTIDSIPIPLDSASVECFAPDGIPLEGRGHVEFRGIPTRLAYQVDLWVNGRHTGIATNISVDYYLQRTRVDLSLNITEPPPDIQRESLILDGITMQDPIERAPR